MNISFYIDLSKSNQNQIKTKSNQNIKNNSYTTLYIC